MFVCTGAKPAPRTSSKTLVALADRLLRSLTVATLLASLTACINPKGVRLISEGTLTGRILDATSRAPIAAATLQDEVDRTAMADPQGGFTVTLPSGVHTLLIHADGYRTDRVRVKVEPRVATLIGKDGYILLQRTTPP
jgi:hypothetical protein